MASPKHVTFQTFDGIKLSALLFGAGEKRPCIIMTNGFTGLKEHFMPDFASRFQAEGYTVLIYDNRCWGASEGSPRNHVDPYFQTRDYVDAFDFATTLPEVDPGRIVFWGTSMSGGNVICAAALEKRICAVIAQVPFISGELASMSFDHLRTAFLQERGEVRRGSPPTLVPVIPETTEEALSGTSKAVLKDPAGVIFNQEMDRRGYARERVVTLQSCLAVVLAEPRSFIHRLAPKPILMVVADQDTTNPTLAQLDMYERALQPKRLHIVKGSNHFELYYGALFEDNIKAQLDFLKEFV